jgi:hypothetical protein
VFNSFYPITVSATAFLFFFRARAIYGGSRLVTLLFGFLWLSVLATSITIPISGRAISFGDPPQCIVAHGAAYNGSSGITITVHDTMVFFAISYRLVSNFAQKDRTHGEKIRELFSGANLPAFSKALFNEGQMYYMCASVPTPSSRWLITHHLLSSAAGSQSSPTSSPQRWYTSRPHVPSTAGCW